MLFKSHARRELGEFAFALIGSTEADVLTLHRKTSFFSLFPIEIGSSPPAVISFHDRDARDTKPPKAYSACAGAISIHVTPGRSRTLQSSHERGPKFCKA